MGKIKFIYNSIKNKILLFEKFKIIKYLFEKIDLDKNIHDIYTLFPSLYWRYHLLLCGAWSRECQWWHREPDEIHLDEWGPH
jgi:hypothetical protein